MKKNKYKQVKLGKHQIEELLFSFHANASRYPSFEEFCHHGKKLSPSMLPDAISPVEREKLRQKVKYIVSKQKKIQADFAKDEIHTDAETKYEIQHNLSQDSVTDFKEVALAASMQMLNQKKHAAILHQIILKKGIELATEMLGKDILDRAFNAKFDIKLLKLLELRKLL